MVGADPMNDKIDAQLEELEQAPQPWTQEQFDMWAEAMHELIHHPEADNHELRILSQGLLTLYAKERAHATRLRHKIEDYQQSPRPVLLVAYGLSTTIIGSLLMVSDVGIAFSAAIAALMAMLLALVLFPTDLL